MACKPIRLRLDGTNQNERLPDGLKRDSVLIDNRSEQELYAYIYQLAAQLAYYNYANQREGNWQKLFPSTYSLFEQQTANQPHLGLLWVFLQLFKTLQKEINQLTEKHLGYYFEQFLGFKRLAPEGDKVFLQFELNRQAGSQLLNKGLRFPAGKLGDQEIFYELDSDVVINKASIVALQSILIDELSESRIYKTSVANSLDGNGKKMPSSGQGWRPFGESQIGKSIENSSMQPARVGFALASPVLLLAEGRRNIEITFSSIVPLPYFNNVFKVMLSGEEGWLGPVNVNMTRTTNSFTLGFTLENNFPAVTPPSVLMPEDRFSDDQPIAMMLIDENESNNYFDNLKDIRVNNIEINVIVEGLRKSCTLENDQASLSPLKAFQPFGAIPEIGSTFKIRNAEMLQKNIIDFSMESDWKGLPNDFDAYYSSYGVSASSFRVSASINYNGGWISRFYDLFNMSSIAHVSFSHNNSDFHTNITHQPVYEDELFTLQLISPISPASAFGHQRYPSLLSDALIRQTKEIVTPTTPTPPPIPVPNPPYTPTWTNFSVNYRANANLHQINVYQVEPFGVNKIETINVNFPLFPQWEEKAALFIGLRDLTTPAQLNLLWDLEETSDSNELPPQLEWSVLKGNSWYQLSPLEILNDQTLNLQQTGIVSLSLMDTSGTQSTLMDPDLVWLKISVKDHQEKAKLIVSVLTQVASSTLSVASVIDQYDGKRLPEGTIRNMEFSLPAIKKVQQPLTSFGGRARETGDHFYARVSERIRHKNRGICLWDYEHLILEQFPELFKVKCLVHASAGSDLAPGNITLIVIPGFKERSGQANPFQPAINYVLQNKITSFIYAYISPHITVHVQTPVYEEILVDLKVKFKEGYDPTYYRGLLVTTIERFLSPWAFENGVDVIFENKIHKSVLWSKMENLEYVDYIADFKLYHSHNGPSADSLGCMEIETDFIVWEPPDSVIAEAGVIRNSDMIIGENFIVGFDSEQASASTSRSVLVSSRYHRVNAIIDDTQLNRGISNLGIGQMIIEWDFIVSGYCTN